MHGSNYHGYANRRPEPEPNPNPDDPIPRPFPSPIQQIIQTIFFDPAVGNMIFIAVVITIAFFYFSKRQLSYKEMMKNKICFLQYNRFYSQENFIEPVRESARRIDTIEEYKAVLPTIDEFVGAMLDSFNKSSVGPFRCDTNYILEMRNALEIDNLCVQLRLREHLFIFIHEIKRKSVLAAVSPDLQPVMRALESHEIRNTNGNSCVSPDLQPVVRALESHEIRNTNGNSCVSPDLQPVVRALEGHETRNTNGFFAEGIQPLEAQSTIATNKRKEMKFFLNKVDNIISIILPVLSLVIYLCIVQPPEIRELNLFKFLANNRWPTNGSEYSYLTSALTWLSFNHSLPEWIPNLYKIFEHLKTMAFFVWFLLFTQGLTLITGFSRLQSFCIVLFFAFQACIFTFIRHSIPFGSLIILHFVKHYLIIYYDEKIVWRGSSLKSIIDYNYRPVILYIIYPLTFLFMTVLFGIHLYYYENVSQLYESSRILNQYTDVSVILREFYQCYEFMPRYASNSFTGRKNSIEFNL